MVTVIFEGGFLGNGVELLGAVWYNEGGKNIQI